MTREFALGQLCPFSIVRRPEKCRADLCMGWRAVTLYVAYKETEHLRDGRHVEYVWQLNNSSGAHVVDCGYCGACGAPYMQAGVMAPLGYDEQSLIGLTLTGGRRTANRLEKELMKARGVVKERDLSPRSHQNQYAWAGRKGKK